MIDLEENLKVLVGSNDAVYFDDSKLDYTKSLFGFGQYKLLRV
ncbi:hypothetical protein [Numidum massiliense]|nr:hypothetical protein [Numidum massiliense]